MTEIRNPVNFLSLLPLLPAEKDFVRCLAEGQPCIIGNGKFPKKGIEFGKGANVIRGEVIRFFAYGGNEKNPVLGPAIHLQGAWICGENAPLDLTHATIRYVLRFFHCYFVGRVEMIDSKCPALYMSGSHLAKGLRAAELRTDGPVHLCKGFVANGKVDLSRAHIGGDLNCINGKFNGQGEQALMANLATVKGAMFMHSGFSAEGEVRLLNARVDGDFDCKGGRFNNLRGNALSADGMAVGGNVFLNKNFSAEGQVKLPQAQIGGDLDCSGGSFHESTEYALNALGATVGGNMFLCGGFVANGQVNISDANIGGHLDCIAGRFHKPEGNALTASRVTTSGDILFCKDFFAEGQVDISGANVGGNLDCAGGRFDNLGNYALNAERMATRGHVFLNKHERRGGDRPFFACGRVRFANADIGRNFNCKGGQFYQPGRKSAIAAAGLRTRGAVFLSEEFTVQGNVDLNVAQIGGNFVCKKCGLAKGIIDLSSSKATAVDDDSDSWDKFEFVLDGFTYENFYGEFPNNSKRRLCWLSKRPGKNSFSPLPYEQAAKVLRAMGKGIDAWDIEREKRRLSRAGRYPKTNNPFKIAIWWRLWGWMIDTLTDLVYRPWKPLMCAFVIVVAGAFLFNFANKKGRIVPHQSSALTSVKYQYGRVPAETPGETVARKFPGYTEFNPFWFSVDIFIPLLNLHQESFWYPAPDGGRPHWWSTPKGDGFSLWCLLEWWYWIHITMGKFLTSILLLSVTGLLRPRQSSGDKD